MKSSNSSFRVSLQTKARFMQRSVGPEGNICKHIVSRPSLIIGCRGDTGLSDIELVRVPTEEFGSDFRSPGKHKNRR